MHRNVQGKVRRKAQLKLPSGATRRKTTGAAKVISAAAIVAGALFLPQVTAQESTGTPVEESWTLSAYFENDLFYDTDARYTNGLKLAWTSPDLTQYRDNGKLPDWIYPLVERLPFIDAPGIQRNVTISLGQQIYTPEDIVTSEVVEDDRPYAGWLYLGTGFHNKNPRKMSSVELQVGVVGPLALGEVAQDFIHSFRGFDKANGWDNQLGNELGINLVHERKWRLFQSYGEKGTSGFGFDLIPHAGFSLGNVYTYANAGGQARIGWNLPADFGNSIIRPGADAAAPVDYRDPRRQRSFGLHGFASLDGRAVLRDIFLDGNTFESSQDVTKKPLVLDAAFGFSVVTGPVKVTAARVLRTREFRGQPGTHRFGSVSVSYTF